jgi:methyltransferase-like protein/2-polyprenyl-3-methyl-5-hydroxy-6-metoxy-1,4-benzoquinol methylase
MTELSYDLVPYTSTSFAQTSPEALAVIARIFGLETPDIHTCRVLELGCASGGNIIPLAELYPRAQFVGIDLSQRQVQMGRDCIAQLGLGNVRIEAMSIADIGPDFGMFDYIIAHGLHSWVDVPTQDHVLRVCRQNLHPAGIAFVSHNTRPGWNQVKTVRDLMLFHTAPFKDPQIRTQQARAVLAYMASGLAEMQSPLAPVFQEEMALLANTEDFHLYHEHLEENNNPVYFHEFMAAARLHGLQYLADAELHTMTTSKLPAHIAAQLHSLNDVEAMEQYLDFFNNRRFRNTLLCHVDVVLTRNIDKAVCSSCFLYTDLQAPAAVATAQLLDESSLTFAKGLINFTTSHPLTKQLMHILAEQESIPLALAEIVALMTQRLPQLLPQLFPQYGPQELEALLLQEVDLGKLVAESIINLRLTRGEYSHTLPLKPAISQMASWQLQRGRYVTNCRHKTIRLQDAEVMILRLADGTRTVDEIINVLHAYVQDGRLQINREIVTGQTESEYRQNLAGFFAGILDKFMKLAFFVRT